MLKKSLMALIFVILVFSPAQAQQAAGSAAAEKASALEGEGLVSLNFRDTDIKNVLRMLALKSGVNIVAGPEVSGLVTIELKDVPWKSALRVILETYGYAYEQKGNIITVTTVENLQKRRENAALLSEQEALITKTFILNFARGADVIVSIDKMKSGRGSITYDVRTNALIVSDIQENVEVIGKVIEQLDSPTPQVLIEAKIIETTLTDTENLGIDWTVGTTISASERPHTWPFKESTGNIYARDGFPGTSTTEGSANPEFTYGTLNPSAMQVVLEILKSRTDTNILSNPQIVTLDNKTATISIGDEHPIPTFGNNPDTGTLQTTGLTYRNIGINFEVTPHVNSAGYVTLDIIPEVSDTSSGVDFQGINVPIISIEKTVTSVMIKDGETLVIAGLIKDKVTDIKKKVPVLGDIPFVGFLFRKTSKVITKRDLLIFLTPHIITIDVTAE